MRKLRKIRVGILFGGKSVEHEVSLQSARNVIDALDADRYQAVPIGIDKEGRWHLNESTNFLLEADDPQSIRLRRTDSNVSLAPWQDAGRLRALEKGSPLPALDVVFPILHGPLGEDGTVQGLLRLANLPFVGAGVLGSAVGMDKEVAKRLLREAGIPIARFETLYKGSGLPAYAQLRERLGSTLFIKPANSGSSVGVHRVEDSRQFEKALQDAFRFDRKVLVEEAVVGREIECAVLGNEKPQASIPGEVIPSHGFYSYQAKYIDENGAALEIPASLPEPVARRVRQLSVRAFQVLCCEGLARVDFFVRDDQVLVNELNTMPGFTRISMYPKLWEASGVPYSELIGRLIELALERAERDSSIETSFGE